MNNKQKSTYLYDQFKILDLHWTHIRSNLGNLVRYCVTLPILLNHDNVLAFLQ